MPTFTPPTQPESIPGMSLWSRFSIDVGRSVVRIGGLLVLHPYPLNSELLLLQEGVDYFLGGRTYTVSNATAIELAAAGFTVTPDENPPGDPPGFGEGGFGSGGFGL